MAQPDVAALFRGQHCIRGVTAHGPDDRRTPRVVVSCGFDWNQLVSDVVQLYEARERRAFFEGDRHSLKDIRPKLLPGFRLREDRLA